jgi:hypothetical protein
MNDTSIEKAQRIMDERNTFKYFDRISKFDMLLLSSDISEEEMNNP